MILGYSTLADLARLRRGVRRMRVSSWDRTGGNDDFVTLAPGEARTIADLSGPGCIRHLWMTMESREPAWPRRIVLRAWWDGEAAPSVEAPIGDFFGIGHGIVKNYTSLPLQMSPEDGRAFNCWFPMPFATQARLEVTNEAHSDLYLYFYADYAAYGPEATVELAQDYARFHAQWRRQNPVDGWADLSRRGDEAFLAQTWRTPNLDGAGNYVILEATGKGHYVGCHLDVDCFQRQLCDWWGEGDDMIFIDGEALPSMVGTGSEDYFCHAWGMHAKGYPYTGTSLHEHDPDNPGRHKCTSYRFHIEDPVHFTESLKVTIEHGHANLQNNDYSSTAYWYQTEPHAPFPPLPDAVARRPRPDLR